MHPAQLPLDELVKQVLLETTRGPGPGGQHRNKTDTSIRATHRPTGMRAIAGERRSRALNERQALRRLRLRLAAEHREPVPAERFGSDGVYEPSGLWKSRRVGGRMVVRAGHADFPGLLAECLDLLEHCADEVGRTARLLGLSTAQLVRFLAKEPGVLARLNLRRRERGQRPFQTH